MEPPAKNGAMASPASNVVYLDSNAFDFSLPNDPQQEFFFNILEGLPPVAQKRRLLQGCLAQCISRQNCEILMSALGLRGV